MIVLLGNSVQLGNKSGMIRLKEASGNQGHAVSYSREDAKRKGRYRRFKHLALKVEVRTSVGNKHQR